MTENADHAGTSRRGLLRAGAAGAVAATGIAAGAGTAAAAYDGWFDDVDNYEGTYDFRGQDEVVVTNGAGENGLLFDPPAILVDPGTTVVWEWTGEGGEHNVAEVDGAFESELTDEAGHTFEYTFDDAEEGDVFRYVCTPHEAVGMKGAVAVGDVDDELIDPDDDEDDGDAPGYGDWFDDVDNYEGTHDFRGQDEVTVMNGAGENGLRFDPPAILVDPGTTVVWEWTGEGGQHNVAEVDGAFESELVEEAGHTFEHTFDEEGIYRYVCTPHEAVGMKGAVAVGDVDDELIGGEDDEAAGRELTTEDIAALALATGFAGVLLVPLFYAAHKKDALEQRD